MVVKKANIMRGKASNLPLYLRALYDDRYLV